jgi:hypothetical protein
MLSALITTHIPNRPIGLSAPRSIAGLAPASYPLRAVNPVSISQASIRSEQIQPATQARNNNMPFALVNSFSIHVQHSGLEGTSITEIGGRI